MSGTNRRLPAPVVRFLRLFVGNSTVERFLISIAALITAVVVSSLILLVASAISTQSYNPLEVFAVLLNGAFGSPFALSSEQLVTEGWSPVNFSMGETLKSTTLLLFSGLAVAVAFRGDMFNIGGQGQAVFGGLAATLALLWTTPFGPSGLAGTLLYVPLGLAVGATVGGLWGAIPGALKAYSDANEVITTIMLNFIATGIAFYLVRNYFKDPTLQSIKTKSIPEYAQIQSIVFPTGGSFAIAALVLALATAVGIYYVLRHTTFGYDLRVSGGQPAASLYGGANAERMIVSTMTLSGALAGIAGAIWSMMVIGAWRQGVPGIGFDGITVSVLAGNNPLGVIPAALLFGVLKGGSTAINFQLGVPPELVGVLRGLIILFIAMPEFFRMLGRWSGIDPQPSGTPSGGGDRE